jgi:hypothetical protein
MGLVGVLGWLVWGMGRRLDGCYYYDLALGMWVGMVFGVMLICSERSMSLTGGV